MNPQWPRQQLLGCVWVRCRWRSTLRLPFVVKALPQIVQVWLFPGEFSRESAGHSTRGEGLTTRLQCCLGVLLAELGAELGTWAEDDRGPEGRDWRACPYCPEESHARSLTLALMVDANAVGGNHREF